jgi:hypothetical protein
MEFEVIPKCQHGVYMATRDEVHEKKAYYCFLCRPTFCLGDLSDITGVFLSKHKSGDLPPANKNPTKAGPTKGGRVSCPRCGNGSHYIKDKLWVCAECDNEWTPPRQYKHTKAMVSIRTINAD